MPRLVNIDISNSILPINADENFQLELISGMFGRLLPRESDFFTWQPNDTIGYLTNNHGFYGPLATISRTWAQTTVLVRDTLSPDTIRIRERSWKKEINTNFGGTGGPFTYYSSPYDYTLFINPTTTFTTGQRFVDGAVSGGFSYGRFVQELPLYANGLDSTLGYITLVLNGNSGDTCFYPIPDGGEITEHRPGRGLVFSQGCCSETYLECFPRNGLPANCINILVNTKKKELLEYIVASPITTELQVQSPIPLHLTLQDLQGRIVAEDWETTKLSTTALPTGMYLLHYQDKQGRVGMQRVVKEK